MNEQKQGDEPEKTRQKTRKVIYQESYREGDVLIQITQGPPDDQHRRGKKQRFRRADAWGNY